MRMLGTAILPLGAVLLASWSAFAAQTPTPPPVVAPSAASAAAQLPQSPKVTALIRDLKVRQVDEQTILNDMGAIVDENAALTQQKGDLEAQVQALTARLAAPKQSPAQQRSLEKSGGLTNDLGQPLKLDPHRKAGQ